MLALGLLLNTVGIGLFCWLIVTLAVYASPFFVAVSVGMAAFHLGENDQVRARGASAVAVFAGAGRRRRSTVARKTTTTPNTHYTRQKQT